jgi:6-phosphogluconolactonase
MRHELVVLPSAVEATTAAAQLISERAQIAVAEHGHFTMAASGGHSPWLMFADLAQRDLPWDKITIYQVDERITSIDDPDRNLSHLRTALGGAGAKVVEMPVDEEDLRAAVERYEVLLPDRFDLIHLGLGPDGHTASLVPDDPVLSETRPLVWTTTNEYQGRRRMTLTYMALARANELMWLVTGDDKVDALGKLLGGDRTIPAGRVEGAPVSTVIADEQAAAVAR